MNISQIISEADLLVPNEVDEADKIIWLNAINQEFFNVVKIPQYSIFESVLDQATYSLGENVRQKNIDLITCGVIRYQELTPDIPNPLNNTYYYNDTDKTLTLSPPPYKTGLQGIVRFSRIATTSFTLGSVTEQNAIPDAPAEYHWTYVVALASYLANAMEDTVKAANYESQYRSAWNTALAEYSRGVQNAVV